MSEREIAGFAVMDVIQHAAKAGRDRSLAWRGCTLGGAVGRGSSETEEKESGIPAQSPMLPCMGRIRGAIRMCVSVHRGVG